MNQSELETKLLNLISNAGIAKSLLMEVIALARNGNFTDAENKIEQANKYLREAHQHQTDLITLDANNENQLVGQSVLMIHAQDHVMNAVLLLDLAKEFIHIYKKIL